MVVNPKKRLGLKKAVVTADLQEMNSMYIRAVAMKTGGKLDSKDSVESSGTFCI